MTWEVRRNKCVFQSLEVPIDLTVSHHQGVNYKAIKAVNQALVIRVPLVEKLCIYSFKPP